MSRKAASKPRPKNPPVKEFKSGAIIAAVWLRTTETGMSYLEFSLERLYKPKNADNWQRSKNFFARHASDVADAARQAEAFIKEHADNPEALLEEKPAEREAA